MKHQCWIHFIGKQYYTIEEFIKESQKHGISRAIAPGVLKKMNVGDLILLAYKDGAHSKIFGYFKFDNLIGLSPAGVNALKNSGVLDEGISYDNPIQVERGCGKYEICHSYGVNDTAKFMDIVGEMSKEELGRPMIGGSFKNLWEVHCLPEYVLTDIPFQQGFRLFNFQEFKERVQEAFENLPKNRRWPKVRGQFYSNEVHERENILWNSFLTEIKNYQLN